MFENLPKNIEELLEKMAVNAAFEKAKDLYPEWGKFDWSTGSFLSGAVGFFVLMEIYSKIFSEQKKPSLKSKEKTDV